MKSLIKKALSKLGIQISLSRIPNNDNYLVVKGLIANKITLVFDVGANEGQFVKDLIEFGYKGKIVSFEPLPDAHEKLLKKSHKHNAWTVVDRCAVGDTVGSISINVAGNSVSSSILPMLAAHSDAAPHSKFTSVEVVPILTLDSVFDRYVSEHDKVFIKIDTQGYEWQVLEGAKQALARAQGVLLELSLVPLYEGQKLMDAFILKMNHLDFYLYAIQTGFNNHNTGQTLQADGVFYRK